MGSEQIPAAGQDNTATAPARAGQAAPSDVKGDPSAPLAHHDEGKAAPAPEAKPEAKPAEGFDSMMDGDPKVRAGQAAPTDARGDSNASLAHQDGGDANPATPGEGEQAEDGAEDASGDDFAIAFPEGFEADPEAVGSLQAFAKEHKLTGEQAQSLADMHHKAMSKFVALIEENAHKQVHAWEDEVRADKELGGAKLDATVENAKLMLQKYGTPRLKEEFRRYGMLSHPEFVRFLSRVHAEVSEGRSIGGSPRRNPPKKDADILFGDD